MNDSLFDILNIVATIEMVDEKPNLTEDLVEFISIEGSKWLSLPENKNPVKANYELNRLVNYSRLNKRLKHITIDFSYLDGEVTFYINGRQKNYVAFFVQQSTLQLKSRYISWRTGE